MDNSKDRVQTGGVPSTSTEETVETTALRPGDFRVAWQGSYDGRPDVWNTWYRRTTDGGRTWEKAVRLSDLSEGAPYHQNGGYAFPYGDYMELAVDEHGRNYAIWGEGLSYIGPGGTWFTRGR